MKTALLEWLACPACRGTLRLAQPVHQGEEIVSGALGCESCSRAYPIVRGIPRFVADDSYAGNFSFEWNRFQTTQLDSRQQRGESERRFRQSLDIPLEQLKGQLVLDAGCGMGRFAEIALHHGATVVAMDLSFAVDAAAKNLSPQPDAHVVQANLFALPFRPETFDLIYSLGVLHHTPNPRKAFEGLVELLKTGGKISVTLYSGYNTVYVRSTSFWRFALKRLPGRWLYRLSHLAIPYYHLCRIPLLGLGFQALFPISMHPDPEWRVLDTFDCYSPTYQSYHTHHEVFRWFKEANLTGVEVLEPGISLIGGKRTVSDKRQATSST
ncbi:MAG: methyltransferase domain-containing protein [Candidatus Omnitrophica bacterium]|nr:methyltransferase domain-containing protein [Candidatus Omnitrophota bacterium]